MTSPRASSLLLALCLLSPAGYAFAQGSLNPPGAPAPGMRTLDQLEPRRPISTAGETLTASGSYYLTADLTGNGTVPGLVIAGPNITVDLNGFSIARTLNVGSEPGILLQAGASQARIRNGRIRNWGNDGVRALGVTTGHIFEDLVLVDNAGHGLRAGDEATVLRCLVSLSTGDGIQVGVRSRVEDCQASDNGGAGLRGGVDVQFLRCSGLRSGDSGLLLDERSVALDCTASSNAVYGIFGTGNNVVRGGTFAFNAGGGVFIQQAGRIESVRLQGNAVVGARCGLRGTIVDSISDGVTGAGAPGFFAGNQSVLRRCTSLGATGSGFLVGAQASLQECSASGNATGFEVGDSCQLIDCRSTGNTGRGFTLGSGNQVRGVLAGQNGAEGLHTAGSGNRIEGCTLTLNSGFGLVVAAPGTFNQVLRNTIAQNALGNLSTSPGQVLGPSVSSSVDPDFTHPHGNLDF